MNYQSHANGHLDGTMMNVIHTVRDRQQQKQQMQRGSLLDLRLLLEGFFIQLEGCIGTVYRQTEVLRPERKFNYYSYMNMY